MIAPTPARLVLALFLATGFAAPVPAQTADAPPTVPAGFRATLYDNAGGELFWRRSTDDRGAVRGYEITKNGRNLGVFDALSFYDPTLEPGVSHTFTIVAIDNAGQRSAVATTTLGDGTPEPPGADVPTAPGELHAEVYSRTAAELFWRRESVALRLRYEVRRDGEVVATTNGVSYFTNTLASGTTYSFEVVAIAPNGARSAASVITLTTAGDTGGGETGNTPVLNAQNAEPILRELVEIANGDFFDPVLPIVDEEARELKGILIGLLADGEAGASEDYALVEGSGEDILEDGSIGARYTCLAGGSATLANAFAGEDGRGYDVQFETCATMSSTLGGSVVLDGGVRSIPRAGRGRIEAVSYTAVSIGTEAFDLLVDGSSLDQFNSASADRLDGRAELNVTRYERTTPDGESTTIENYDARRTASYFPIIDGESFLGYERVATADITFTASAPATSRQTLAVDIDLDFDRSGEGGTNIAPEDLIGQWQSGRILVDAPDGSRLRAEPLADDPTTLRIIADGTEFERPWAEGFQIDCLVGCR